MLEKNSAEMKKKRQKTDEMSDNVGLALAFLKCFQKSSNYSMKNFFIQG